MTLVTTVAVGLKEVWTHKFRSLLTMLGIILGVASLVGMAAIIKGMENGMRESMIAMGGADKVLVLTILCDDVPRMALEEFPSLFFYMLSLCLHFITCSH